MEQETIEETISPTSGEETLQINNDPIQEELQRVKPQRTETEKAIFAYRKQQEKLRELGVDPSIIGGVQQPANDDDDDNRPLTVAEWKKFQAQQAAKTAKELASQRITNNSERELVEYYLDNRIVPSGNAEEDLKLALAAVNSVRNGQIASMASQRPTPNNYSNSSGMPPVAGKEPITDLTETERTLKASGLVTDDDIRKAREEARNNPGRF